MGWSIQRRSFQAGRGSAGLDQVQEDPSDLGGRGDDGKHSHGRAATAAVKGVYLVNLGQQPRPCRRRFPGGDCACSRDKACVKAPKRPFPRFGATRIAEDKGSGRMNCRSPSGGDRHQVYREILHFARWKLRRIDHEPDLADILTGDVTALGVLDPIIQRVSLVGGLRRAIRTCD